MAEVEKRSVDRSELVTMLMETQDLSEQAAEERADEVLSA